MTNQKYQNNINENYSQQSPFEKEDRNYGMNRGRDSYHRQQDYRNHNFHRPDRFDNFRGGNSYDRNYASFERPFNQPEDDFQEESPRLGRSQGGDQFLDPVSDDRARTMLEDLGLFDEDESQEGAADSLDKEYVYMDREAFLKDYKGGYETEDAPQPTLEGSQQQDKSADNSNRERSREKEKLTRRSDDITTIDTTTRRNELLKKKKDGTSELSESEISPRKGKRLRKDKDKSKKALQAQLLIQKENFIAREKRLLEKQRQALLKPKINLNIPKNFESKQSFSNRFKVLENLGEGGSCIVRKVACKKDGKICAVKSCKSNESSSISNIKRECKILNLLNHPNIIKTYGIFESSSNFHLILKYFQGESLAKLCKRKGGKLSEKEARGYLRTIIRALKYCHDCKVAHRDIKPENILVGPEEEPKPKSSKTSLRHEKNRLKIIDFAFASRLEGRNQVETFCGTPSYMSPEIFAKLPHCPMKADVWALGVLAFKVVLGDMPFVGRIILLQRPREKNLI